MTGEENTVSSSSLRSVTRREVLRTGTITAVGTVAVAGCTEESAPSAETDIPDSSDRDTPTATMQGESPTSTSHEDETTQTDTEEKPDQEDGEESEGSERTPDDNWGSGWYVKPSSWASSTPGALDCEDEDAKRYEQGFGEEELDWGDGENWSLRVDEMSVEHGMTVRLRLKNTTNSTQQRRAHSLYNLQVETEAGWEDVRIYYSREQRGPPSGAVRTTDPGEYYEWEITVDGEEISEPVCPALKLGRYRFAYYGFEEDDEDDAIAAGFNLSA